MKPIDLCKVWQTLLGGDGARATVDAIREALLTAGPDASAQIRAIELLVATSSLQARAELSAAIRRDLRALRDRSNGGPRESVRLTMLRRKHKELSDRLAALQRADPAQSQMQDRMNTLSNDQARLRGAISQQLAEQERLTRLLGLLNEGET